MDFFVVVGNLANCRYILYKKAHLAFYLVSGGIEKGYWGRYLEAFDLIEYF